MFALQNAPLPELDAAGAARCGRWTWSAARRKFDLTLSLQRDARRGSTAALEYNTDLFDAGHRRAAGRRTCGVLLEGVGRATRAAPVARCRC